MMLDTAQWSSIQCEFVVRVWLNARHIQCASQSILLPLEACAKARQVSLTTFDAYEVAKLVFPKALITKLDIIFVVRSLTRLKSFHSLYEMYNTFVTTANDFDNHTITKQIIYKRMRC